MKIIKLAVALAVLPFLSANAAKFNAELQKSIFPLQDQVRFYNREVKLAKGLCDEVEGAFAIYNLQNEKNQIKYECVGEYHATCGDKCLGGDVFFGKYTPELPCAGEVFEEGQEKEDVFITERETCRDIKNRIVWERNRNDRFGFDHLGYLFFFKTDTSTTSYRSKKIQRKLVRAENEYMMYDNDAPQDFFHVKYERDDKGNIVRETHFNKDDFPYMIYEAEYQNNRCVKITQTDAVKNKSSVYEFEE